MERHVPCDKPIGRSNSEKVLTMLKYILNFILKFKIYIIETGIRTC